MATAPFSLSSVSGKDMDLRLYDPANGDQFDFGDDTWKDPGSVGTGEVDLTEDPNASYGKSSVYRTTIDMSRVNAGSPAMEILAAYLNKTDGVLDSIDPIIVLNSQVVGHGTSPIMGADFRTLSDVYDQASRGGVGPGSIKFDYSVTVEDSSIEIPNVMVWVATDADMNNRVAVSQSNYQGVATFFLDPGTYYFWRQHANYTFDNPDVEEVTA